MAGKHQQLSSVGRQDSAAYCQNEDIRGEKRRIGRQGGKVGKLSIEKRSVLFVECENISALVGKGLLFCDVEANELEYVFRDGWPRARFIFPLLVPMGAREAIAAIVMDDLNAFGASPKRAKWSVMADWS